MRDGLREAGGRKRKRERKRKRKNKTLKNKRGESMLEKRSPLQGRSGIKGMKALWYVFHRECPA